MFDQGNVVRLTIWDDNQDAIRLEGVPEDTPIRVSNGYVKQGLDGKPNLNLGRRGRIDVISDESLVAKMVIAVQAEQEGRRCGDDQNHGAGRGRLLKQQEFQFCKGRRFAGVVDAVRCLRRSSAGKDGYQGGGLESLERFLRSRPARVSWSPTLG